MLPLSGTGVRESLALAQAPLTRMTSFGTFFTGFVTSEKSPPFGGALCGSVDWLQAIADTHVARMSKKRKNPECIFLLRIFANIERTGETPSCLASTVFVTTVTASAGSSVHPAAGWLTGLGRGRMRIRPRNQNCHAGG